MREDFYPYYFRIEDRHWWFVGRRRIILSLLDAAIGAAGQEGRRVLDVGCGTGTMLSYLERYGEPSGVEADVQAIELCRSRGITGVQLADPPPLPFEDGRFDLVTALDVLEHVDDDERLLVEMRRVLRPGGVALVTVPAFPALWGTQDVISHHKRRYRARELRERVLAAGLEPARTTYFNTLLFPPIAALRLVRRLRPAPAGSRSDFELTREGRINDILAAAFGFEARLLSVLDLPFGVSLACLARYPETSDQRKVLPSPR
jgi:SAM-dependent methyltransferase